MYIVTTAKKGKGVFRLFSHLCVNSLTAWRAVAKHLEPLKGGKIPVEILVTSKDPADKAKAFDTCIDAIKKAGVSCVNIPFFPINTDIDITVESRNFTEGRVYCAGTFCR